MLMLNQKTGQPNLLTLLKIHMISSYGLNIIQKHIIPQRKIGVETPPSKDIPLGLKKGFLGYVLRGGVYCKPPPKKKTKIEKFDFFKMSVLLPPMILYEKTHLGGFVSPLKRFERYFNADLSKSIF